MAQCIFPGRYTRVDIGQRLGACGFDGIPGRDHENGLMGAEWIVDRDKRIVGCPSHQWLFVTR